VREDQFNDTIDTVGAGLDQLRRLHTDAAGRLNEATAQAAQLGQAVDAFLGAQAGDVVALRSALYAFRRAEAGGFLPPLA